MPRTSKSSGRVCKQSVARVATVLKGRPYKLGGDGSNSSADFDCFGMMVVYYRLRYGAEVLRIDPKTYNPMEKYWECENHETIMVLFKKFMDKFFVKVNAKYKLPGDIIWTEADDKESLGLYLGAQNMLTTMPRTGCFSISTKYYKIKDAYRWLVQHH